MKFLLVSIFLVLVPGTVLGEHANFTYGVDYEYLTARGFVFVGTNIICARDSCTNPSIQYRSCSCESDCSEFGTCCIDSPHRVDSVPKVECRNVVTQAEFTRGFLLVSTCPPKVGGGESPWKNLCEEEWNGEDDMMRLAPVSSLDTLVSYKNYYCFRCHEGGDRFKRWPLLMRRSIGNRMSVDFNVTYDERQKRWIVTTDDARVLDDFDFEFLVPGDIIFGDMRPKDCRFGMVSDCHGAWTDEDTREKCRSYTSVVFDHVPNPSGIGHSVAYRNPHCALCNFVKLRDDIACDDGYYGMTDYDRPKFAYYYLFNIRENQCEKNQVWDPYGKKCRKHVCGIPGYVLKEGRCTRS